MSLAVDVIFVGVVVFVVFATTFICQIFGNLWAKKVFYQILDNEHRGRYAEKRRKDFALKRRRSASTSSEDVSDFCCSVGDLCFPLVQGALCLLLMLGWECGRASVFFLAPVEHKS